MAVGSLIGGVFTGRLGARTVALTGVIVAGVGLFLMHLWPDRIAPIPMGATLIVAGLGFGVVIAPVASVAISAVRRTHFGIASGLVVVTRLVGMTVALSVLSAWGVGRLSRLLENNAPMQKPGESAIDYQTRLFAYISDQTVHYSLVVLRETFVIAGLICFVAIIPVLMLRTARRHNELDPAPGATARYASSSR
jgi:MFS family permease